MVQKRVAIVILNWNGKHFLEQFLPLVVARKPEWAEVFIADNASNDDSLEYLAKNFPRLPLIRFSANHGYAGGYNMALKQIEAEYYVLLNSDIEVSEGWIEPMIQFLDAHPEVAAAQPKILSWHNPQYFEYAGAAGGFADVLAYPFCRGRVFSQLEPDKNQHDKNLEVLWATGACLFLRANAFWQVGGFDHRFFAHMEEIDLCWRLQNHGYKIMAISASKVFHVGGGTLPKSSPFKTFLNFRNSLWLLTKNMPTRYYYPLLPLRLGLDFAAALFFMANGKMADSRSVFKAHWAFLRFYWPMRRKANNLPKNLPTGVFKGSIAFRHFILGAKTFADINPKRFSKKKK
jgi:GT2 family glycosyltransferase